MKKKKINIKFVQITRGNEHSLKLQYFKDLMENLSKFYETITLEIYFIVPFKNINIFNIPNSKIEGQGLLSPFKGWKKNEEIKQVKIYGIKNLFQ